MQKKNGKWVVIVILALVILASGIAFIVQQKIAANRGKPVSEPAPAAESN